ncbi:MAG: hypothetical protein O6940_08025 [Ignavibacteria bacterium]|nr:hypothetical protein [Ignavibacteria bacterium]
MNIKDKEDLIIEFVVLLFINFVLFSLGKIFYNISFLNTVIFSIINAVWMLFLLLPFTKMIKKKIETRDERKNRNKRLDILKDFEKRQ